MVMTFRLVGKYMHANLLIKEDDKHFPPLYFFFYITPFFLYVLFLIALRDYIQVAAGACEPSICN